MSDRHALAFVADRQIPPTPPPASDTGTIGWLRENLFRGPVNTLLTLASIALILWIVPGIIEWAFVDAVWFASSLDGCREINAEGACWAVIVERFDQFIYGFYPGPLRWRPNLAFALLLLALAYVLFDNMPYRRVGLVFAAIYPVIAYFLIWGGSIWGPLLIIATAPIAYIVYRGVALFLDPLFAVGAAIAASLIWLLFGVGSIEGAITRVIGDARYADRVAALEAYLDSDIEATVAAVHAGELSAMDDEARATRLSELVSQSRTAAADQLSALRRLPSDRERIAVLSQEIAVLREALPDEYDDVETARELRAANPPAEIEPQLRELVAKQTEISGLETRSWRAYEDLGRLGLRPVQSRDLGGFLLATIIGVAGITLSLPIGILLALGRRSGMIFIKSICIMFIEFIRGVPLITLLFVANSVLAYFFPPGSNLDLILRVVIMVTLFASAYMAEVIRGGLAALPQGQYEAADSLGLDYWKSMRLIILPQALKISIPNIVSTFIGLFKDTTLVVVIGLLDPIGLISSIRADSNWQGIVWEFYVFVGLFFFIICFAMSRYSQYLERKLATDRR
jgi:His/Glu/Gln/Arg/opine family amino acid ABC transporter permease subunit